MQETEKRQMWALYLATVVGWKLHPRNETKWTVEECAQTADAMLRETEERWDIGAP